MARIFFETRPAGEDVRRWFNWLDEEPRPGGSGDCLPPMDVVETPTGLDITVDLPGVDPDALKVLMQRGVLVIAGTKRPARCQHADAAFHLAERSFGRFARAVRVAGPFDAGRATATLANGELRITLPRIDERRGREIVIPVTAR